MRARERRSFNKWNQLRCINCRKKTSYMKTDGTIVCLTCGKALLQETE